MQRILHIATNPDDLVLDSFLGSGTTAAVAHKMGRRWIGIEMGEHAETHCLPRLHKVIEGEQGGISQAGGLAGRRRLPLPAPGRAGVPRRRAHQSGDPLSGAGGVSLVSGDGDAFGPRPTLSTGPLPRGRGGKRRRCSACMAAPPTCLLYNGILGDRRPQGGNVLTQAVLAGHARRRLPPHDGPRVIYGEACRLSAARLKAMNVTFKQIPYDIRTR